MLVGVQQARQKWGGAHSAIDNWLAERQQLLVMYCELAGLPPYQPTPGLPDAAKIEAFCEILMDYISAGHFEIYTQLGSDEPDGLDKSLLPQIMPSTDTALAFNDKYAEIEPDNLLKDFDRDLSGLGQQLEERFELEDQLIHSLYTEHL